METGSKLATHSAIANSLPMIGVKKQKEINRLGILVKGTVTTILGVLTMVTQTVRAFQMSLIWTKS